MPKKLKSPTPVKNGGNIAQLEQQVNRKKGIQSLSDYYTAEPFYRLDEMVDQTVYIVKLEPLTSEQYGAGFKIWFKDYPNAKETGQCATFGMNVVPMLTQVYANTHDGALISLDSPIKVTVRKAGRSITLE
jgi:hypothetical protein